MNKKALFSVLFALCMTAGTLRLRSSEPTPTETTDITESIMEEEVTPSEETQPEVIQPAVTPEKEPMTIMTAPKVTISAPRPLTVTSEEEKEKEVVKKVSFWTAVKLIGPILRALGDMLTVGGRIPIIVVQVEDLVSIAKNVDEEMKKPSPNMDEVMTKMSSLNKQIEDLFKNVDKMAPKLARTGLLMMTQKKPTQPEVDKLTGTITGVFTILKLYNNVFGQLLKNCPISYQQIAPAIAPAEIITPETSVKPETAAEIISD